MSPQRIQMTRKAPWRHRYPDAVIVARPTRWGNPFLLGDVARSFPSLTLEQCHGFVVNQFRDILASPLLRERYGYPSDEEIRAELAGRDLACWCKPADLCHADVLLRVAAGGMEELTDSGRKALAAWDADRAAEVVTQ